MKKLGKCFAGGAAQMRFLPAVVFACLLLPSPVRAQCEDPATATSAVQAVVPDMVADMALFEEQERNYADQVMNPAIEEINARLDSFDRNFRSAMTNWWKNDFEPQMKDMTKQLSIGRVDQNRILGAMVDSQLMNESIAGSRDNSVEARRRYKPNELSCQTATAASGQNKAFRMARALNRGYEMQNLPRNGNSTGTPAAQGKAADQKLMWDQYSAKFCDPLQGDQGCLVGTPPGPLTGKHTDIPGLLWGDKQTFDAGDADNREVTDAALHYLISPSVVDPVPASVVPSPQGHEALLLRRSRQARVNTIYTVVGQMIAERAGGGPASLAPASGVDAKDIGTATGLPDADASDDASYREIMTAMTKERFRNPAYITRMVQDPEGLVREQGSINALRMQQMNDLYKRLEEMVVMEAAEYASELDHQKRGTAIESVPIR